MADGVWCESLWSETWVWKPVAVSGQEYCWIREDACVAHTSFGYFVPFSFDVLTAIGVLALRYGVDGITT